MHSVPRKRRMVAIGMREIPAGLSVKQGIIDFLILELLTELFANWLILVCEAEMLGLGDRRSCFLLVVIIFQ